MIEVPAVAVIFRSVRRVDDGVDYTATAERMAHMLREQDGFLGMDSVRDSNTGVGITVCYWRDDECIRRWRDVGEHRDAQLRGAQEWYESYDVVVADVTRSYSGGPSQNQHPT